MSITIPFTERQLKEGHFVDKELPRGLRPMASMSSENEVIVTYRGPNFVGGGGRQVQNDGELLKRFGGGSNGAWDPSNHHGERPNYHRWEAANIAGFGRYRARRLDRQ